MADVFGGISYDSELNSYVISVGALEADIQTVLNTALDGASIRFESGIFDFSTSLTVARDNLSISGTIDENGATVFKFASTVTDDGFVVRGKVDALSLQTLPEDIVAGNKTLTIADTSNLKAGDVLHIFQDNDTEFLSSGIYDQVRNLPGMAENPLRESLVEIESIDGNVVTLKHELAFDMTGGMAKVEKIDVLKNISISDLTVTYDSNGLGTLDPNLFDNPLPQFENHATMVVKYTDNIELSNLTLLNTPSHALEIRDSIDAHLDGLVVDGAYNKGSDGNGYGLYICGTTNSTFEHLTITDVRHSVLFSSWNAEINNFVQVDFTNRDINYHGSPDHSNTVIVNESVYSTDGSRAWMLVSPGAPEMHPYTDISQNTNLFGHAEGSFRDDIVFGWDNDAVLYGNGGNDQLTGGAGDDFISGGMDNDTLTGGNGMDTFIFHAGDGQDVVTDFDANIGADVLEISGYNGISSLADIKIEQVGGDTLLTLMASRNTTDTILLKNVDAALLDESSFSFVTNNAPVALSVTLSDGTDYILTSGVADDVVTTFMSSLVANDMMALGDGVDTLAISSDSFTFDTALYTKLSGIDVIDVTQSTGAKLYFSQSFLDSSDTGTVKVVYGAGGIQKLGTSGLSNASAVLLEGNGTVYLADGGDNVANVSAFTHGSIIGASGNDTFVLSGSNSILLDGGRGNDRFILQSGTITSNVSINGGLGTDELYFTGVTKISGDSLKNVQGIEKLVFTHAGCDIQLKDSMVSSGAIKIEANSATLLSEKIRVGGLTQNAEILLGNNVNLYLSGTTTLSTTVRVDNGVTGYVKGSMAGDILIGNNLKDTLNGMDGDDIITGGLGNDSLTGGAGSDTFKFTRGDATDIINDFQSGESGDIVHLTSYYAFSSFDDVFAAMSQKDATTVKLTLTPTEYIFFKNKVISDFTADNFVFDNSQVLNLTLQATSKVERLITVGGNDIIEVNSTGALTAGDVVNLGAGTDVLRLSGNVGTIDTTTFSITGIETVDTTATTSAATLVISDAFAAGSGPGDLTVMVGTAGLVVNTSNVMDVHTVVLRGDHVGATLSDGVINTVTLDAANIDFTLNGGTGDDVVRIRGGNVLVNGNDGVDKITVMAASLFDIRGGAGDDVVMVNTSSHLKGQNIDGGAGIDEVRLYQADNLTYADLVNMRGIEKLTLGAGVNALELDTTLFDTSLTLKSGSGTAEVYIDMTRLDAAHKLIIDSGIIAHLTGEAGDIYQIETTSRTNQPIYGSVADETLNGGTVADAFYAGDGNDHLSGGYGNDSLFGDNGNDWLAGGRGNDVLTGGLGNDVFVFSDRADGIDTITDFHLIDGDRDQVDLTALFDSNGLGAETFGSALASQYLVLQQSGADVQVLFDRNGIKTGDPVFITTIQNIHVSDLDNTNVIM